VSTIKGRRPSSYDRRVSDRTNTTSTEAGVLRPEQLAEHALLRRYPCDGPLGRWVENLSMAMRKSPLVAI